jgi:hypothetical protein
MARASDHPMTGQENRQRVLSIGLSDGTDRRRISDPFRLLAVGSGLAIGDFDQGVPDALLKDRAFEFER